MHLARTDPRWGRFIRPAHLAKAHEFVRPHSELSRPTGQAVTLHALIAEILSPYPALEGGRIAISGDDEEVDDRSATPLALLIHELATNATKYGALSAENGQVDLTTCVEDDHLIMVWAEHGGPMVQGSPAHSGFGTVLSELSIERQLGGELAREWLDEGLRINVKVPRANLRRRSRESD